uniref:Uncharacterized protein n=1 Tax=Cucumis melo TaxID=3656 RepID=A0A9I9DWC6_CUCME
MGFLTMKGDRRWGKATNREEFGWGFSMVKVEGVFDGEGRLMVKDNSRWKNVERRLNVEGDHWGRTLKDVEEVHGQRG